MVLAMKEKVWVIEYRWPRLDGESWRVCRRYETEEQRDQALAALLKKHGRFFEYRKKPNPFEGG